LLVNKGQIGFVVFGALTMLMAPTSIDFGNKRRTFVLGSDNPKRAYFQRGPKLELKPRLLAVGAGLGIVWAVVWLKSSSPEMAIAR
jgi:hypothetical protein